MVEILYAPDRERVVTTNAWAFMHWLRMTRGIELADWAALQRWTVDAEAAFRSAVKAFANPPPSSSSWRGLAELLLYADLRPDDTLLVVGSSSPWRTAELLGARLVQGGPQNLLATAAGERATVLVAPAQVLAEAAFQRPGQRPNLADLRTIIATGGPLSPEGRRRIYTWVKSDVMLLARSGDTFWGNPLEPVLAQPAATPAFLTPPASALPPR